MPSAYDRIFVGDLSSPTAPRCYLMPEWSCDETLVVYQIDFEDLLVRAPLRAGPFSFGFGKRGPCL